MATKKTEEAVPATAAVPDYLKQFQGQDQGAAQSLSDSSTSVPRISLKGKKFRLIEDGEEIAKPAAELAVVILDVQPEGRYMTKSYYDGAYNANDTAPPDCSSSDGIRPDLWVSKPQADNCATCPKNVFGSATSQATGKRAKACKDSKRMWVVLPDDVNGTVFALNIPVTSLKNASVYGKSVAEKGFPLFAVITQLTMDDDSDFPVLHFESAGFLDEADGLAAYELTQSHSWRSTMNQAPAIPSQKAPPALGSSDNPAEGSVVEQPAGNASINDVTDTW